MDPKTFYKEAIATASRVVEDVTEDDFDNPTPDTDWTVYDLLSHMLYELAWVADIVNGQTVQQVGKKYDGDLIGDDLLGHWANYREVAGAAIDAADLDKIVHLSYGDVALRDYLMEAGSDEAIHAWDLAESLGQHLRYDEPLLDELYTRAQDEADTIASSNLFGPRVDVPNDADDQAKLLAIYGRREDWQ